MVIYGGHQGSISPLLLLICAIEINDDSENHNVSGLPIRVVQQGPVPCLESLSLSS